MTMQRPMQCPAGTWFDSAIHAECPCPSCWAERSSARLVAAKTNPDAPDTQIPPASPVASGQADSHRDPVKASLPGAARLRTVSPGNAALLLGTLGLLSALLSFYFPGTGLQVGLVAEKSASIMPAIYFAPVVCLGLYLWGQPRSAGLVLVFAATAAAWIAAYEAAAAIYPALAETQWGRSGLVPAWVVAGLAGGFVGSLVTVSGILLAHRGPRNPAAWIRTILLGTATGALLSNQFALETGLLFIVWQSAVAASIAHALVAPRWSAKSPGSKSPRGRLAFFGIWQGVAFSAIALVLVLHGSSLAYQTLLSGEKRMYAAAGGDVARLRDYVASCKLCRDKTAALASIESRTLSQSADEDGRYRAARGSLARLESFVRDCKICASAPAAAEEISYLSAAADSDRLNAYVRDCRICEFKSAAGERAARLKHERHKQQEQTQYRDARGNLDRLQTYLKNCQVCEFAADTRTEILGLELKAKTFVFETCNQTTHKIAVALAGRRNPSNSDMTLQGWGLVEPGACKKFGSFVRGKVQAVAQVSGERTGWYGTDARHCVERPGPFDRLVTAGFLCPSNGKEIGFREFNVGAESFTWNISAPPAFADDEFFMLEVCNASAEVTNVAIAVRKDVASDWTIEGWWSIERGACKKLGRFPKGKVYATAVVQNGRQGWFGTDTKLCVESSSFQRTSKADIACPPSGKIVGFRSFDVSSDSHTWSIRGAPSFGEHEFFDFEVCNKSRKRASVAVMARADPDAAFVVQGWHTLPAGACEISGRYARGTFYAMASVWGNLKQGWWQKDIHLCVRSSAFSRMNSPGYKCSGNEQLVPFRKLDITTPKFSWTLN